MSFWDWKTGYRFQSLDTTAQPGSLDAEAGIMTSTFDRSGMRLICGEADKTSMQPPFPIHHSHDHALLIWISCPCVVKIWKPDPDASPETHPVVWTPSFGKRKF
jgi:pleiotropic regulator 1